MLAGYGQASLVQGYSWLCVLSCQLWYLSSSHAHGRSVQYTLACNVGSTHWASCSSAWVLLSCSILIIMSLPFGKLKLYQGFEGWGYGFYSNPKEVLVSVTLHGTSILRPLCYPEPSKKKVFWRHMRKLKIQFLLENSPEFPQWSRYCGCDRSGHKARLFSGKHLLLPSKSLFFTTTDRPVWSYSFMTLT